MAREKNSSGSGSHGSLAPGVGSVLVAVLCCAGPVLIAAGALGVLGGLLRWWLIAGGAVVVLAAVGYTARRRGRPE